MRLGVIIALSLAAVTGCGATRPPDDGGPPRVVRFDRVELGDDSLTVRVDFIGAKAFDPNNVCTHDYTMTVGEVGGVLEIELLEVPHPLQADPPDETVCTAEGYPRHAFAELDEPFLGTTVRDRAGYVHFVRRPAGLVELEGLPEDWAFRDERSVEESPTGRWQRTWDRGAEVQEGFPGRLDLYQAFGGPAEVSGGEEQKAVEVGGDPATLYRAPHGELVLVWTFEGDGLALVANEADLPADALLELAGSVREGS